MKENLGFIFATNCSSGDIREVLANNRRWQGATAGQISNVDLVLPSGPTGMDPSQTSFFQLLNIGTQMKTLLKSMPGDPMQRKAPQRLC